MTAAPAARPATGVIVLAVVLMVATQTMLAAAVLGPAVLAPKAAPAIGVAPERIGVFVTVVYFAAMLAGLAAGRMVTRWGALRVCQFSLVIAAIGLAAGGTAWITAILTGAIAVGIGYGTVNPASSAILARIAPPAMLGLILSLKQTGVPLGGMLAGAALPSIALAWGWQAAIYVVAACSIIAAIACEPARASLDAMLATRPITPAGGAKPGLAHMVIEPIRLVMTVPALREVALTSVFYSANQMTVFTFFVAYVNLALGHSLIVAGALFSTIQLAGVGGRILWGALADRAAQPRRVLGALGIASGVAMLALVTIGHLVGVPALAVLALALGATAIGWNGVYFAEIVRNAPADRVGLATGGAQFFTFFGALVGPAIAGLIVSLAGSYAVGLGTVTVLSLSMGLVLLARSR